MTLRDLSPKLCYNLTRRCEKIRKEREKLYKKEIDQKEWEIAFSKGVSSFLEKVKSIEFLK